MNHRGNSVKEETRMLARSHPRTHTHKTKIRKFVTVTELTSSPQRSRVFIKMEIIWATLLSVPYWRDRTPFCICRNKTEQRANK